MCPNHQHPGNHPKHRQSPTPDQYHFHPQYIWIGHQKTFGRGPSIKRERGWTRSLRNNSGNSRSQKKEGKSAPLCKLCIPNSINTKPNSPLIDPLIPALEEKEENKREEEGKHHATDYYPPSPIYVASYEEDAST